jgi:Pre-mRNA cleavage complex II protein Clp1
VVKVPKSGGTVCVPRDQQKQIRDRSIVAYFKGPENELQPSLQKLRLADIKIYKAASSVVSQQPGLLPSGMSGTVDPTRVALVEPSADMVRRHNRSVTMCFTCAHVIRAGIGDWARGPSTLTAHARSQAGLILAVSYAQDAHEIAASNVAGFMWVQQVDVDDGSMSVICPHHSTPPSTCFLMGSIRRNLDNVTL